jgi:hypothetical protein
LQVELSVFKVSLFKVADAVTLYQPGVLAVKVLTASSAPLAISLQVSP